MIAQQARLGGTAREWELRAEKRKKAKPLSSVIHPSLLWQSGNPLQRRGRNLLNGSPDHDPQSVIPSTWCTLYNGKGMFFNGSMWSLPQFLLYSKQEENPSIEPAAETNICAKWDQVLDELFQHNNSQVWVCKQIVESKQTADFV